MKNTITDQITTLEEKLLTAFQNCSIAVIDELLHDSALFVYPNGMLFTKADIMNNYRTGNSSMTAITATDRTINIIDDTAVVAMVLELQGMYKYQVINNRFRYIRVWKRVGNAWKVISVSGVPL